MRRQKVLRRAPGPGPSGDPRARIRASAADRTSGFDFFSGASCVAKRVSPERDAMSRRQPCDAGPSGSHTGDPSWITNFVVGHHVHPCGAREELRVLALATLDSDLFHVAMDHRWTPLWGPDDLADAFTYLTRIDPERRPPGIPRAWMCVPMPAPGCVAHGSWVCPDFWRGGDCPGIRTRHRCVARSRIYRPARLICSCALELRAPGPSCRGSVPPENFPRRFSGLRLPWGGLAVIMASMPGPVENPLSLLDRTSAKRPRFQATARISGDGSPHR